MVFLAGEHGHATVRRELECHFSRDGRFPGARSAARRHVARHYFLVVVSQFLGGRAAGWHGALLRLAEAEGESREVVLAAVQQNGDALRYASPELRAMMMLAS